jgi:hypothetical protein
MVFAKTVPLAEAEPASAEPRSGGPRWRVTERMEPGSPAAMARAALRQERTVPLRAPSSPALSPPWPPAPRAALGSGSGELSPTSMNPVEAPARPAEHGAPRAEARGGMPVWLMLLLVAGASIGATLVGYRSYLRITAPAPIAAPGRVVPPSSEPTGSKLLPSAVAAVETAAPIETAAAVAKAAPVVKAAPMATSTAIAPPAARPSSRPPKPPAPRPQAPGREPLGGQKREF